MNLYAYLIAAVVGAAMLAGGAYKVYQAGGNSVRAEYTARDLKAAQDYAEKEREITEAYRTKEAKLAQSFATVGTKLQQERVKHAATKRDLDAALVAGTLVLRDPGTTGQACGGQASSTATSASGNNDHAGGKLQTETAGMVLSQQTAKWLVDFADEADSVATQLSACQQLLIDERK